MKQSDLFEPVIEQGPEQIIEPIARSSVFVINISAGRSILNMCVDPCVGAAQGALNGLLRTGGSFNKFFMLQTCRAIKLITVRLDFINIKTSFKSYSNKNCVNYGDGMAFVNPLVRMCHVGSSFAKKEILA